MPNPTVTHTRIAGSPANPKVLIDGPAWDDTHTVTGLENIDNTSDADKPISTATQTALDAKQPLDADLTAVAALSGTGIVRRTGANTWSTGTAVANSELATMATATFKGNVSGTTATPSDITAAQVTAALPVATSSAKGLVPQLPNDATKFFDGTGNFSVPAGGGLIAGGRLTVSSGIPVMVSAASNQTTLYWAPFFGSSVPIYNGTIDNSYPFTSSATDAVGLSLALGSNWSANSLYDVFVALNSGVATLCTGPAWSSGTSRGTGAGTTQLAMFNGRMTNAISITGRTSNSTTIAIAANQATYVGTILTDASNAGQITWTPGSSAAGGGAARLSIWNAFNRVMVRAQVSDSASSWTYSGSSPRPTNNSTTNRVTFVAGLQIDEVNAMQQSYINTLPVGASFGVGVALDAINTMDHSNFLNNNSNNTIASKPPVPARYAPQFGVHFIQAMERADGTNTTTLHGGTDVFGAPATMLEFGMLM